MSHLEIKIDGRELWSGEVNDWHPLPDIPRNPQPGSFTELPRRQRRAVRQAMSKAAHAAIDKALARSFGDD